MYAKLVQILEMIRFSHTLFAMPFALIAALLAWSIPSPQQLAEGVTDVRLLSHFHWQDLLGVVLCMVSARSAAMAFNRLVDRRIDARNPRTAQRHLPSGSLSVSAVVVFTVLMSLAFVLSTFVFWPNRLPALLAVPVLVFIGAYSVTKRFTAAAHFWLGASLMLAPLCTWIALRGEWLTLATLSDLAPPLLIGMAVLLWVSGFDIIYACQDFEFDAAEGLHSAPSRLGIAKSLKLAAICHALMVILLFALPYLAPQLHFGMIYLIGVVAIAVLIAYEHVLVRPDNLTKVNVAFFNVNVIVSVGLLIIVALDLAT